MRSTKLRKAVLPLMAVVLLLMRIDFAVAETPVICPGTLPAHDPSYVYTTWQPQTFRLPRWMLPEGDEIPFQPLSFTRNVFITPQPAMGGAWYTPTPAAERDWDQKRWRWEGQGGTGVNALGPGVRYTCDEELVVVGPTMWRVRTIEPTGDLRGYAFPLNPFESGSSTREGGGGSEGDGMVCYEYFEWWYDWNGAYHEEVLYSWCEPIWET